MSTEYFKLTTFGDGTLVRIWGSQEQGFRYKIAGTYSESEFGPVSLKRIAIHLSLLFPVETWRTLMQEFIKKNDAGYERLVVTDRSAP